jgi:NAD(P)H-hydrate repair Nnr-like enzyme with NAD(P)H-hydrate dehydratase domain
MAKRVVDLLVDVLSEAGAQRVNGGSGDSLNGIADSILHTKRDGLDACAP